MTDLIKCSRCCSRKLPEYFEVKKTTGIRFKTCTLCRERVKLVEHVTLRCPLCEFSCDRPNHLIRHRRAVHEKIKDAKCQQCEATFSDPSGLVTHINGVHNQIRNQKCPRCEYSFATKQRLQMHIKGVHDKIRDHKCPTCDFVCTQPQRLPVHMKICTGAERISSGEYAIKAILEAMKIPYEREMRFIDCKSVNALPFDFYLHQHVVAIEYDGEQHFGPVTHWGGQPAFEKIQLRDAIKTAYCATNNIRLLRIKYTDFEHIEELIKAFLVLPPC